MNKRLLRAVVALILTLSAAGAGYQAGTSEGVRIEAQTVAAPAPGSVRIVYSLDEMRSDEEIIALIDQAKTHIYFAIYTFTLPSIADALVAAARRGVKVYGVVDHGQAASEYGMPIVEELLSAGIPLVVEKHESGGGIMHIKALVTESAYATGSYNWTNSATKVNDEILEIGTDPALRQAYENILKKLYEAYKKNDAAQALKTPVSAGTIDYRDALKHVGEYASVRGVLVKAHESKSGTVFLDFCNDYKTCPFTGVIFADDAKAFGDLSSYVGKTVTLTGKIALYEGKAEIILSKSSQLTK